MLCRLSLIVVRMKGENWRKIEHIVDGIKDGICHLRYSRIDHVKWYVNSVAHDLAREAIKHVINEVLLEDITNGIYDIVIQMQLTPFLSLV